MNRTIAVAAAFILFAASCGGGRKPSSPDLPADHPISSASGWALVVDGYAAIRAAPDMSATVLANARKGAVARVEESRFDARGSDAGGTWYRLTLKEGTGWLHQNSIRLYPNEARARREAGMEP